MLLLLREEPAARGGGVASPSPTAVTERPHPPSRGRGRVVGCWLL